MLCEEYAHLDSLIPQVKGRSTSLDAPFNTCHWHIPSTPIRLPALHPRMTYDDSEIYVSDDGSEGGSENEETWDPEDPTFFQLGLTPEGQPASGFGCYLSRVVASLHANPIVKSIMSVDPAVKSRALSRPGRSRAQRCGQPSR